MITDITIYEKPLRWQPNTIENTVDFYRYTNGIDRYHEYHATRASLARVKRFMPPASQRMIRSQDEDGWYYEKSWGCDRPVYNRYYHLEQKISYTTLYLPIPVE